MLEDTFNEEKLREDCSSYNVENDSSGGIGIGLADAIYGACGKNVDNIPGWNHRTEKASLTLGQEKLLKFYRATAKANVFPFNIYHAPEVKAKIIKEAIGYTKLKTEKGVSTKIEECTTERIGEVFKKYYQKSLEVKSKYPDLFR